MRLIDADKIKQSVTNEMLKDELNSPVYCTLECVIADIDNQPTAYDVDKVVERLEEERNPMYRADGSLMSERRLIEIDKAVEIVKSGGIAEEKKTEWKKYFTRRFGRIE